eukprot:CAMPEP_0172440764 /NCGR_PEP_ID=MMETSP1065-20121228/1375_1 /TAXON_ID=265537 /ORGANISM="Amphiprora paludosa, Strain CCMP125" /LENGTH=660 /DNA_ID=CAMNT_0013189773 /DNA_START=135 /DNA_END=2120 /DNA_ORIENTATION=-
MAESKSKKESLLPVASQWEFETLVETLDERFFGIYISEGFSVGQARQALTASLVLKKQFNDAVQTNQFDKFFLNWYGQCAIDDQEDQSSVKKAILQLLQTEPPRKDLLERNEDENTNKPPAKRHRDLQTWEVTRQKYTVKTPAEVPPPELAEETTPPPFVAPKGWLDDFRKEVLVQFNREESENPRVYPVAVVRCSRGGKTRALHELARSLSRVEHINAAIIYVSFNGQTQLSPEEKLHPLEAVCRRIMYTATTGKPNQSDFDSFAKSTAFRENDVNDWLGTSKCILLIDELNLIESTMDAEFATFLKKTFLMPPGRGLVFSSHVVSINDTLTNCMRSPSDREVRIQKLPIAQDLVAARKMLSYPTLSPHLALYLGLIPSLYYTSMQNRLPRSRKQTAIQAYLKEGLTPEKVESLLLSLLTGCYTLVPSMFLEFMDNTVIDNKVTALWIPFHMAPIFFRLSMETSLPLNLRGCLKAIHDHFENFGEHKIQSGDGWESLFIVTLLTRCVTNSFCDLVSLPLLSYQQVAWNSPFDSGANFGCETVNDFVSGIPLRNSANSISIYYPSHAKFEVYDVILACWDLNMQRQLFGYQLKEGNKVPKASPMGNLFKQSFLIRGQPTNKDSIIRGWTIPSDDSLDTFFGVSAVNWSPKCWAALLRDNV